LSIGLFIFILFIYFLGASRTVFGGDSGDIILSYFFAGVPHPPGYPLNTMFGWLLTRAPIAGSFAFRANLVSSLYMAGAVGVFAYLMYVLAKNKFVAVFSALVLAFTPLFWLYAHVAEVFQLLILLISVSLVFLFKFWVSTSYKKDFKCLILAVLFFGLAVFHHHMAILLLPAYAYAIWTLRKKIFWKKRRFLYLGGAFMAGVIPYLFVPIAAARKTPVNWDDAGNIANFIRLLTRADYGTFTASQDLVGSSIQARMVQFLWYVHVLRADFGWIGIALAVCGMAYLFLKKRTFFWFFLLGFFFSGPFFQFYSAFPPIEPFTQGVSERFFLLSYLFVAVFLGFGILFTGNLLINFLKKFVKNENIVFLLVWLGIFIYPLVFLASDFSKATLANFVIGGQLGHDIMASANPPGIVFLQGDTITFNTQYSYYAEGAGRGSIIILSGRLRHADYRQQLVREFGNLSYGKNFVSNDEAKEAGVVFDFLKSNYRKIPIYSVFDLPLPKDYSWVRQGMLMRLYSKDDLVKNDDLLRISADNFARIKFSKDSYSGQYRQLFLENIIDTYGIIFSGMGDEFAKRDLYSKAQEYYKRALALDTTDKRALYGLGRLYINNKQCKMAKDTFTKLIAAEPSYAVAYVGLATYYRDCEKSEVRAKEYEKKAVNLQQRDNVQLDEKFKF